MLRKTLTLINKLGLHARAAANFVKLASGYDCEISVSHNAKKVNGKSIMGMMMLAAAQGSDIEITTSGRDETRAMEELGDLIQNRFGEGE
ncbi:MAG: HPr family phosphocarrier protein [Gammaproteobacteria bacterium]|nr:HPr family phosphocarrier protein [Gammaproteobacteria bacterium]